MSNYHYDVDGIKNTADNIMLSYADFKSAREKISTIVRTLNLVWKDPVNIQFSSQYLNNGDVKAEELEKLIKEYGQLMRECSVRYGSAIDSGNSFLSNF